LHEKSIKVNQRSIIINYCKEKFFERVMFELYYALCEVV